jgi:predicted enzyme related to lactoylglutathione lyase
MPPPFGVLKYLYVASARFDDDLAYYRDVLKAELVWNFHEFGANVAAFKVGQGPMVLIADHRKAPNVMPVFIVDNLKATVKQLKERGWAADAGPFEIPDGPCYTFSDPSGNQFAIFENVRPDMLLRG